MEEIIKNECITIALSPLVAALVAGLFGRQIGRVGAHCLTILGVATSFILSAVLFKQLMIDQSFTAPLDMTLYIWGNSGGLSMQVGFWIDALSVMMLNVVTFVSLMVHIYSIGYMKDDAGYQRFFSFISLFTFAMLMLVMANNFLQLFFGWEAVGLVSYLLIGFWYKKESAIHANFKAFLVNRIGDFGFILGIGGVLMLFGTIDYAQVFETLPAIAAQDPSFVLTQSLSVPALGVVCILLFVGAMGKSAQVPLHVWLPDSMEGPTPISALIHAATMVTAGVFMVARMSPMFELSDMALSVVLVIGSITCFFMGLLGIVSNDIKRVVAYSTLSQLGYMMVALGASAYAIGVFHLLTHAFFKALLFLGAGSVIVALHHEQDIRKMGQLWRKLPITHACMLIGSLALIGFPFFSGFYSKDLIIESAKHANIPGAKYAYWAVLSSVFVTALYSFRMYFIVFHSTDRVSEEAKSHCHEPAWVIWLPLVILAIPSVVIGALGVDWILGEFFGSSIVVAENHPAMAHIKEHFHGAIGMGIHGFTALPFWLAMAGVVTAWFSYQIKPQLPVWLGNRFSWIYNILIHKYGFDLFNEKVIAPFVRLTGKLCWWIGDRTIIDGIVVDGGAKSVNLLSTILRRVQTGYLYHYALAMVSGLVGLLLWYLYI